jgi:hypothetical protein
MKKHYKAEYAHLKRKKTVKVLMPSSRINPLHCLVVCKAREELLHTHFSSSSTDKQFVTHKKLF